VPTLEPRRTGKRSPAKFDSLTGFPVDDPHSADLSGIGIKHQAMHHAVRTNRNLAGGERRLARVELGLLK